MRSQNELSLDAKAPRTHAGKGPGRDDNTQDDLLACDTVRARDDGASASRPDINSPTLDHRDVCQSDADANRSTGAPSFDAASSGPASAPGTAAEIMARLQADVQAHVDQ